MPSGNLIAIFRGPFSDAKVAIQKRLKKVLELNAWLVGRLHKTSEGHGIALRWSDKTLSQELKAIDDEQSTILHINPPELKNKLHINQPYENLARTALKSSYAVPIGKTCLKKNLPLFTLTLVEVDKDSFAVFISISHLSADGYTAYAIMNMVLMPNSAAALDPQRDHSFNGKLRDALGHKEKSIIDFSLPGILNAIGKFLFLPRPKGYFFRVNMDAVEQEKRSFKKQKNASPSSFVSTNDILCSTLARMMRFTSLYMAINFRNRFTFTTLDNTESTGERLAGNY